MFMLTDTTTILQPVMWTSLQQILVHVCEYKDESSPWISDNCNGETIATQGILVELHNTAHSLNIKTACKQW